MTIADMHAEIADHCAAIAKLFLAGAKVSVVVRNPAIDKEPHSAAVFIGDDDADQVIAAIQALCATRPEIKP